MEGSSMASEALTKSEFRFGETSISCFHRKSAADCQRCWTMQDDEPQCSEVAVLPCQPPEDDIGLDVWPATTLLCRYLADNPSLVRSAASVLELGSGVGVAGILAIVLGAARITLTDYDAQVLGVLQHNVDLNGFSERASIQRLDWKSWRGKEPDLGAFDLLLGADLLYVTASVQDFVEVLKLLLAPRGVFLLAHQTRRSIMLDPRTRMPRLEEFDAPLERFRELAQAAGLQLRELLSVQPDSGKEDTGAQGSFCLFGVGWSTDVLERLPGSRG